MKVSAGFYFHDVGAGLAPPVAPLGTNENTFRSRIIPSAARPLPLRADFARRNLSYGFSVDFLAGGTAFTGSASLFAGAGFPTVKYLRIFSRRFAPRPRIASKSSTLLNAPYDFRICNIFSAVDGPIPGTCCNSCDVAVLMFTGFNGGFFFPLRTCGEQIKLTESKRRENRNEKDRHAMAEL
jgi:hypothetical protein